MGDNCPESCDRVGIHFCMESGTHCDTHCICSCKACVEERAEVVAGRSQTESRVVEQ